MNPRVPRSEKQPIHPDRENQVEQPVKGRWLDIEEVRLVSDLRIMHAKVEELHQIVNAIRRSHDEDAIFKYADQRRLAEDISRSDEIYLWFVTLKEFAARRQ
jgi:hypothetical protein